MEFGGDGPVRAVARRARDAREHGDRVLGARRGDRRGRRHDAARGSRRAGPAPSVDGAAREGRRRPIPARSYAGGVHTIDLSTIRPMVATPGDPDRGIACDPKNGALRRRRSGDVHDRHRVRRLVHRRQGDDIDMYARVMADAAAAGKQRRRRRRLLHPVRLARRRGRTRASAATSSSSQRTGVEVIKPGCGACIGCGPGRVGERRAGHGVGDQPQLQGPLGARAAVPGVTAHRRGLGRGRRDRRVRSGHVRRPQALTKYRCYISPRRGHEMARSLPREIWIVGAKRTAFGTFGGALKDLTATDLAVDAVQGRARAGGLPIRRRRARDLRQRAADLRRRDLLARHVGLRAGAPIAAPALTVNRLCGSGFEAIVNGARADPARRGGGRARRRHRDHDAGAARAARRALGPAVRQGAAARGHAVGRAHRQLHRHADGDHRREPGRAVRDHAARSATSTRCARRSAGRRRTRRAASRTRSSPVELQSKKGPVQFAVDEHPRPQTTIETLAKLPPVFKKDGVVTAGNASGICDGAAALVLASEEAGQEARPEAARAARAVGRRGRRSEDHGHRAGAGDPPRARRARGTSSATSISSRSTRRSRRSTSPSRRSSGSTASAPTSTAARSRSATRSAPRARASPTHLVYELRRRGEKLAVGSACIGGGQGIAVIVESA